MAVIAGFLFVLAMVCYLIGFIALIAPEATPTESQRRSSQTKQVSPPFISKSSQEKTAPMKVETLNCPRCGGSIKDTDRQCPYCGSTLLTVSSAQREVPTPPKLDWIKPGDSISVRHPVQGELTVQVMGYIVYEELWQQTRGAQSPWVPTGSAFAGFWLETDRFLLNWQNRFYLLDEETAISDADIQRDFAPHARKFAQSDQTATVIFPYPPSRWRIDDIGKFHVQVVQGEGLSFRPGAIGRFIHASGDGGRALVVEDYESGGGGQDTVWKGYQIQEKDVQKA